ISDALALNPVFKGNSLFEPIVLLPNKRNPAFLTAIIKVLDDRAGHVASALTKQSIFVCSEHRPIKVWEQRHGARQCTTCQKWGHTHRWCDSKGAYCAICGEGHTTSTHGIYCGQCIAAKQDPLHCVDHVHCVNCEGTHEATSHECIWFKTR
ncbi:hypothetical protein M378DRAFT_52230, partial [Amanita muscaria Koide BX008]